MNFGQPGYFHLFWLCAGLVIFFFWAIRKKRRLLAAFCALDILPKLEVDTSFKKQKNKAVLLLFSVFFIIFALTQPRWGFQWEDLKQEGVDIIVAIDVSQSMLAEDIKPNRLERAKRKVKDLIRMFEGDRIGLVAFAGTAFLQCPLTLDYSAIEIFLDIIDTDLIPVPGTAIGHAIRTSAKAFSSETKTSKAIILITDGEDHAGNVLEAAKFAKDQGVKVFAIGIGQDMGAPIPQPGAGGGFKQDEKGEVTLSRLDESMLEKITLETGGTYVRSVTGDMDLSKIYLKNIKQRIEKKELKTARRKLWHEKFQWFVLLALLCLLGELAVSERNARTAKKS